MNNWGEFQTAGDEDRARRPDSRKHSWISWICLVLLLSAGGVLLATFALRLLILLTVGLALGWFGSSRLTTLDIDGKTWATMIGVAIAIQLCWQVGQLAVPKYGETAGSVLAFFCTNILVGSVIGVAQLRQSRREQAEKIEKKAYEERLRLARERIAADKAAQRDNS